MTRGAPVLGPLLVVAGLLVSAMPAAAQRLTVGLLGERTTYNEVQADDRRTGFGATGTARWDGGAWVVEGELAWRSVSPAEGAGESVTLLGGGIRGRYQVWRTLSVEVGGESRTADPEFTVQDVGMLITGLHYSATLSSLASMEIRGGAIPWSSFSGGGESGIGVVVGLGLRFAPAGARWGGVLRYDFQRIDRTVRDVDVPIQLEGLRIGFEYGLF